MKNFQIGDAVISPRFGEGIVDDIAKDSVLVKFKYYSDTKFIYYGKDFELFPLELVRDKPSPQFKPGQVVVVSKGAGFIWRVDIYSHAVIKPVTDIRYVCISRAYKYCRPLEGNEHLIGTFFDESA